MKNNNVFDFTKPEQIDPLQELLRDGARKMPASAIGVNEVGLRCIKMTLLQSSTGLNYLPRNIKQ